MKKIILVMSKFFSIFIFCDAPQPWQFGFQDSAAPGFSGIVDLHNIIFFYLVVISVSDFWILFNIIYYYNEERNPIAYKYLTHGSTLETIWTISPAFILIAIAFPSFRLLYIMDSMEIFYNDYLMLYSSIVPLIPRSLLPSKKGRKK